MNCKLKPFDRRTCKRSGVNELFQQHHEQNKGEQWYNPMLECKEGHAFNGDTAPTPDKKMKYMVS